MIVRALGGNGLALCPPLIISGTQIDELLGKLASALDATLDYANAQRLLLACARLLGDTIWPEPINA